MSSLLTLLCHKDLMMYTVILSQLRLATKRRLHSLRRRFMRSYTNLHCAPSETWKLVLCLPVFWQGYHLWLWGDWFRHSVLKCCWWLTETCWKFHVRGQCLFTEMLLLPVMYEQSCLEHKNKETVFTVLMPNNSMKLPVRLLCNFL
jgi:hypothetical protein